MSNNPLIDAGIRKALGQLYDMGAEFHANYWLDELHQVNGYPIEDRWNAMTLRQIQSDVANNAAKLGIKIP